MTGARDGRTRGTMGLCPIPQQGTCSLHPFFASRRFKEGGEQMDCDAIHRGEGIGGCPRQTPYFASRFEIRKNRGCQANDNDISRKNEAFVPEGFQRAMRQTGAVNARKALWWGDGAKPHIQNAQIFVS